MNTQFVFVVSIVFSLCMVPTCEGQGKPTISGPSDSSTTESDTTSSASSVPETIASQTTSIISPSTTINGSTTTPPASTTTTGIHTTTTQKSSLYKGFDVGSFFGGFALCAALVVIILIAWKFLCSAKKPDYNTI